MKGGRVIVGEESAMTLASQAIATIATPATRPPARARIDGRPWSDGAEFELTIYGTRGCEARQYDHPKERRQSRNAPILIPLTCKLLGSGTSALVAAVGVECAAKLLYTLLKSVPETVERGSS